MTVRRSARQAVRLLCVSGAVGLLTLASCRGTLSPLSNRLKVGEESYIVFAAEGEDRKGDLFASPPEGGQAFQVTFTRVDERAPALSPDGSIVAFLRSQTEEDTAGGSLVLLNLVNGAERRIDAPVGAVALHWSADGSALLVRTTSGILQTGVPPQPLSLSPVSAADRPARDSLFRAILGDPPVGEASPCRSGRGVCARLTDGDSLTLSAEGSMPLRWGGDSVAYLENGLIVVRPLGGGRTRTIRWTSEVRNLRGVAFFAGVKGER